MEVKNVSSEGIVQQHELPVYRAETRIFCMISVVAAVYRPVLTP